MSQSGKQSPLGVNVNGSLLQNIGFYINPVAQGYMGTSKTNTDYTMGTVVGGTCLRLLAYAINDAYTRGVVAQTPTGTSTYDNLISIGAGTIPALGDSKPPTYIVSDPSARWQGEATTGYSEVGDTGQGQSATWIPYNTNNANKSITQWGYLRLPALQAWNEFNWNGIPDGAGMPEYKDFVSSFLTLDGFVRYSNTAINAMKQGQTFLEGTYSNMNDLISADITGVSLSTTAFGQDCITAGKIIDLSKILKFGLPSVLLQTIKKYNAQTQSLSVALLSSGLISSEIDAITRGTAASISKEQEQRIYGAFLIIVGQDLADILVPLNCKTEGLYSLADLLNIKKIFPNSYRSLTVPIYNANPGPTNSKTYYPIFEENAVSIRIESPEVKAIVGTVVPPGLPPIIIPPSIEPEIINAIIYAPPYTPIADIIQQFIGVEEEQIPWSSMDAGGTS